MLHTCPMNIRTSYRWSLPRADASSLCLLGHSGEPIPKRQDLAPRTLLRCPHACSHNSLRSPSSAVCRRSTVPSGVQGPTVCRPPSRRVCSVEKSAKGSNVVGFPAQLRRMSSFVRQVSRTGSTDPSSVVHHPMRRVVAEKEKFRAPSTALSPFLGASRRAQRARPEEYLFPRKKVWLSMVRNNIAFPEKALEALPLGRLLVAKAPRVAFFIGPKFGSIERTALSPRPRGPLPDVTTTAGALSRGPNAGDSKIDRFAA